MTASIVYNGELRCTTIHTQSKTAIESDAPTDNRGRGERFSPTDLTCTSLGLCMLTTMAIKATDMGIELKGASATVQKHMSASPPRRIVKIEVAILVPLAPNERDKQVLEAAGNACPVARSLHPEVEQVVSYAWGS